MASIYRLDRALTSPILKGAGCAFGVFDGVHLGHRFLIEEMLRKSHSEGAQSVILTFDRDPEELFFPTQLKKIMSNEDRIATLATLGADAVVLIPFTTKVAGLSPCSFLDRCFGENTPTSLHIGADFRFGMHASGTIEDIKTWAVLHDMGVAAYDLYKRDGLPVSSSRIRTLLLGGDIEQANDLLGYRYRVGGVVQPGRNVGHTLGFATANLRIDEQLRVLADGVYAAYAIKDAIQHPAAVSVGVSPTFADCATANVEIHLIDFKDDLYKTFLRVDFVSRLRSMMKFDSVDELTLAVNSDIAWVRAHL